MHLRSRRAGTRTARGENITRCEQEIEIRGDEWRQRARIELRGHGSPGSAPGGYKSGIATRRSLVHALRQAICDRLMALRRLPTQAAAGDQRRGAGDCGIFSVSLPGMHRSFSAWLRRAIAAPTNAAATNSSPPDYRPFPGQDARQRQTPHRLLGSGLLSGHRRLLRCSGLLEARYWFGCCGIGLSTLRRNWSCVTSRGSTRGGRRDISR